jgi:hypothetical protein
MEDAMDLLLILRDAGVVLYACPIWASLLKLEDRLPEGLSTLEPPALIDLVQSARQVVGTL